MSLLTTTALLTAPSNSAGVAVTGGGGSWVYGAYATLIAVTPAAVQLAGLVFTSFVSGSASDVFWGIELAIGAPGSEVNIGEYTVYFGNSGGSMERAMRFECALSNIPVGSRVSMRLGNTSAVPNVVLNYYQGLDSDHASATVTAFLPAKSGSLFTVSFTPSATPWANSAYIELTSGIANEISLGSVALQTHLGSVEWEVELATGAAGAETPITLSREASVGSSQCGPKALPLPGMYPVATSTRIAARLRKSDNTTTAKSVAVNYYGPTTIGGIPDPTGGGSPGTGTDPAAGTSLCGITAPLTIWGELELDASTARYSLAQQPLNHPSTYFGGPKEPRILSMSPVSRSLSDWTGQLITGGTDLLLDDTDGAVRAAIAANTLLNKQFTLYMIDDDSARAAATPYRIGNFLVTAWQLLGDLSVQLTLTDRVAAYATTFNLTKQLPAVLLDLATWAGLPTELIGKAAPFPYGNLTDESAPAGSASVGVVPVWYGGPKVMADGNTWYVGIIAGCATKGPISLFGSNGGDPVQRVKLDASLYATDIAFPGTAMWTTVTGSAALYYLNNSRRWTCVFVRPGSAVGEAMKDGSVPMVCNLGGIEDVGDGTGNVITSLPRIAVHLLNNLILQDPPGNANWKSIPTIGSPAYSIISTSTFEAVKTRSETRTPGGYPGAFLLGWDLNQLVCTDWLARICLGGDFDLYVNRHGQICASMEDKTLTPAKSFTDINDIADGSYSTARDWSKWANTIVWDHMKRYPPPASSAFLYDTTVWLFAKDSNSDGSLITSQRQTQTFQYEDWVTRDFTLVVPDNVGQHKLARMKRAPDFATADVDLCGTLVELGNTYQLTHFAGPVATVRTYRCFTHTIDVMAGRVTLVGYDLVDAL